MKRRLVFSVASYTGWSRGLALLPDRVQARRVAQAWLRTLGDLDPALTPLIVQGPFGAFRVVDALGHVTPCPWEPPTGVGSW